MSAFNDQVGGGHYKDLNPQPLGVLHAWNLPYAEGSAIYYILRWRRKGGLEDLKKARHTLELLIELEQAKAEKERNNVLHSGARFQGEQK